MALGRITAMQKLALAASFQFWPLLEIGITTPREVYAAVGRTVVLHAETMRVRAAPELIQLVVLLPDDLHRALVKRLLLLLCIGVINLAGLYGRKAKARAIWTRAPCPSRHGQQLRFRHPRAVYREPPRKQRGCTCRPYALLLRPVPVSHQQL